jgi:hypothetical protein
VPQEVLSYQLLQDFLDSAGQFKRIMEDSGLVKLHRLTEKDILSHERRMGIIEQYCYLSDKSDSF